VQAVKLDEHDIQSVNNLGFLYFKLGDAEAAVHWLEATVALDPERAVAHLNLGEAYELLGQPQHAVPHYEKYVQLVRPTAFTRELRQKIEKLRKAKAQ